MQKMCSTVHGTLLHVVRNLEVMYMYITRVDNFSNLHGNMCYNFNVLQKHVNQFLEHMQTFLIHGHDYTSGRNSYSYSNCLQLQYTYVRHPQNSQRAGQPLTAC